MAFLDSKHCEFVLGLDQKKDTFEYHATEHLRASGVYWGLMSMDLMGKLELMKREEIVEWVMECRHENGGFSGAPKHDAHVLYTLSAIQILAIFDALDRIDINKTCSFVAGLQQPDGSFAGDMWGEIDTRFSYCALNTLSILGQLSLIDIPNAVDFVMKCSNFDGGFGSTIAAESHAGQIFCCVGALALANSLDRIDQDLLGWWLCERQLPCGGLNGRPEKKEDVCYSWWVLASLSMMGKSHWIQGDKLSEFILSCQDPVGGGISDRPGNMADVFHTYFGIAGLSMLNFNNSQFKQIDPMYALPLHVVERLKLPSKYLDAYKEKMHIK